MATRSDIISKTIGGVVLGAMVVGGSIFGVNVINDVNARNAVAAQVAAQAAVPAAEVGFTADTAPASQMTESDTAGAAIETQTETDLAAKAAAAKAAQVAAQQAAARAAARKTSAQKSASTDGPIKCPAGSSANSGDGPNDTSCFPDICFHLTLPDPAHPECVTAFKP